VVFALVAPGSSRAAFAAAHVEGLPYVEIITGGAGPDTELPLLIALHGRGDTAEGFATLFHDLATPARVAVLRAPHPWGDGQAWFLGARAHVENRAAIAAELLALADRVAATIEVIRARRPTRGRPVVLGFSQGAMLAWAVAVQQPRAVSAAFPVAGFLFPEMLANRRIEPATMPAIIAFHGDADPLVSVQEDREGALLLEKRGVRVQVRVYPNLGHALPPALRSEIFSLVAGQLTR
jgi:phospholipase/carboxylesterase